MEIGGTVGQRIIYFRRLKGWSQKRLCWELGMRQARLWRIETDRVAVLFKEVVNIAELVDQPLDRFLTLSNPY